MRSFTTPRPRTVRPAGTLAADLAARARDAPEAACLARRGGTGSHPRSERWQPISAAEVYQQVCAVARGLLASGIRAGDRVLLWSRTRYEWTIVDYACWLVGAVVVPVHASAPPTRLRHVLADSAAVAAVVETSAARHRLEQASAHGPALHSVWVLDSGGLAELAAAGAGVDAAALAARSETVAPADAATLLYTSGTTGPPRGCLLTHANVTAALDALTDCLPDLFAAPGASTLLVLPLPDVFARLVQVGAIRTGVLLGHTHRAADLTTEVATFAPTFLVGDPRVFETLAEDASQRGQVGGRDKRFDRAAELAVAYGRARAEGRAGPWLRLRRAAYERQFYRHVRAQLGGRISWLVSGGAPLSDRLVHRFAGIGVPLLEGYGLAESAGALCMNTPDASRIGTVGRPLPGTTVRVAADGELLFRGLQVCAGYWSGADAAPVPAPDGWLHTGDLGEIDEEGFVRVTGRQREVLVTAGGKHVAPTVLEERLCTSPLLAQALVVGDGRPYLAALVTLDLVAARAWASERGLATTEFGLVAEPALLQQVQHVLDWVNRSVSPAEAIRRIRVLATQWSEETGHLTATAKLKRQAVLRDHHDDIEHLYR